MTIASTKLIKELRDKTSVGMMDCKLALEESNLDIDEAIIFLRKKGLQSLGTRANKATTEGLVGHYMHAGGRIGVMVEINCETDFSAKSDVFAELVKNISMHIAAANPQWLDIDSVPKAIIDQEISIASADIGDKPDTIISKIVKGRLEKFYIENCLMSQLFVRDQNISISELVGELRSKIGERVVIKRFSRYALGEEG